MPDIVWIYLSAIFQARLVETGNDMAYALSYRTFGLLPAGRQVCGLSDLCGLTFNHPLYLIQLH